MNAFPKTTARATACILICFLLSGCQIFTQGKKKLNEYCPGLKVGLNGVSWSSGSSHDVYILQYDSGDQKKVNSFFTDKANGFAGDKPRSYMDIKDGEDRAVADDDSILTKAFSKGKTNAVVIYNATTRRIIITEDY
jgi:hypothetical protein